MVIDLPVPWIVTLNVLGLAALQLGLAWGLTRLPERCFATPPRPPGPAPRWERALRVRVWKDRLPDGASWFHGGFAKARLARSDRAYLERFRQETLRGEACHWLALCLIPIFFLWNPWWGCLVIAAYGLLANLPCILVQRFNRRRLATLLARVPPEPPAVSPRQPTAPRSKLPHGS